MNNSSINNNVTSSGMNDDDHYGQQQHQISWKVFIPVPLFVIFVVSFFVLFLIDQCRQQQLQQQHRERSLVRRGRMEEEEAKNLSVANPMVNLSTKRRKEVYKKVFNSKGNRIVLTKDHFHVSSSTSRSERKKKKNSSSSGDVSNHHEDSEIFVNIELGGSSYETDEITMSTAATGISSSSSSINVEPNTRPQQQQPLDILTTNDGTCIICLEDFAVDDVIVWSSENNNDCPHVYHEECMIDYLTTKRRPEKTITTSNSTNTNGEDATETETEHSDNTNNTNDTSTNSSDGGSASGSVNSSNSNDDDDHDDHDHEEEKNNTTTTTTTSSAIIIEQNPCPTCRRNFCSITLDDFTNAIITTRAPLFIEIE